MDNSPQAGDALLGRIRNVALRDVTFEETSSKMCLQITVLLGPVEILRGWREREKGRRRTLHEPIRI